jgi:hypothetical protein
MRRTSFLMRLLRAAARLPLLFLPSSSYNSWWPMSSPLAPSIADLSSADASKRLAAAVEVYRLGRATAGSAISEWWAESELSALLLAPKPAVTVGLAVQRDTFGRIRIANGTPRLADVPPDQDAEEFELHFTDGVSLDILTTREPGGTGAIAKYLARFGEGIQQAEYRCTDVGRAAQILKDKFRISPVYPETRAGADGTRVNFFLVASPDGGKALIELYEGKSSEVPPK